MIATISTTILTSCTEMKRSCQGTSRSSMFLYLIFVFISLIFFATVLCSTLNPTCESTHRDLLLKYLFGGGTFLEIAYLFADIRKQLPGKSLSALGSY